MGVVLKNVNLMVSDMARSLEFYRDVLGLVVDNRSAPPSMYLLEAGGCKLSLDTHTQGGAVAAVGGSELGFETEDVDGLWQRLKDWGAEVGEIREYSFGRSFDGKDPDGHGLTVYRSRE